LTHELVLKSEQPDPFIMPPVTNAQKAAIAQFMGFTQAKETVAHKVR
jgi:hypothetical protein